MDPKGLLKELNVVLNEQRTMARNAVIPGLVSDAQIETWLVKTGALLRKVDRARAARFDQLAQRVNYSSLLTFTLNAQAWRDILFLIRQTIADLKLASEALPADAKAKEASEPTEQRRPTSRTPIEAAILERLNDLVPSVALSYEQALHDLADSKRKSWRGTAVELREALREVLDQLAPDAEVAAAPGYEPEKDEQGRERKRPTMKQKARFILRKRGVASTGLKAPQDATALVEELTASLARSVYERGNIATHMASTRGDVLKVKGYVDRVLCDVLDIHA